VDPSIWVCACGLTDFPRIPLLAGRVFAPHLFRNLNYPTVTCFNGSSPPKDTPLCQPSHNFLDLNIMATISVKAAARAAASSLRTLADDRNSTRKEIPLLGLTLTAETKAVTTSWLDVRCFLFMQMQEQSLITFRVLRTCYKSWLELENAPNPNSML